MLFIKNLIITIYQSAGLAILCAFLWMMVILLKNKRSWWQLLRQWMKVFRRDGVFRSRFFLMLSVFGILGITLLTRRIWYTPWANAIGNFNIFRSNGQLDEDICNNILLFIPFGSLIFASDIKWIEAYVCKKGRLKVRKVLIAAIWLAGGFSLLIELCQSIFWLGTFQLADIFYNTLGGMIGGSMYCVWAIVDRKHKTDIRK